MKNKKINKKIYANILIAIAIMIYFLLINFAYYQLQKSYLLIILKILSMLTLGLGIIVLEIAYKKESGKIAINAVEVLIIAAHTLSIAHIVEIQRLDFASYILVSSYVFSIYYVLKAIFIHTKERREYLNSLSDIKEIVTNEPIKKVATKKGEQEK